MKFNSTTPLPYDPIIDNKIYTYKPTNASTNNDTINCPTVKRAKSVSSRSLTAMFRRKGPTPSTSTSGNSGKVCTRRSKLRFSYTPPLSPPLSRSSSMKFPEEEQFSFNSSIESESESLPDLTADDDDYDVSFDITPIDTECDLTILSHHDILTNDITKPTIQALPRTRGPLIFEIPEIVHMILSFVDIETTVIPQEETPIRRKPLNYKHALLIHGGDSNKAEESLAVNKPKPTTHSNPLFNCLLVNKLFYTTAREIISQNFYFTKEVSFGKYLTTIDHSLSVQFQPKSFVLHKLFHAKQPCLDRIDSTNMNFCKMKWLELYMCPKLVPPMRFIIESSQTLEKLVITGSKVVDNDFIINLARNCRNLQHLDVRACELISDFGIYQLSMYCRKLCLVNLGRKNRGNLITDSSIISLVNRNPRLSTIGLAGCHISDASIWEMARYCKRLERLSLNNCPNITNNSISTVFNSQASYFPQLSVLELRFNYHLTEWKGIIEFKRRQESKNMIMLVEVCELLMTRISQQELVMDKMISQRIFSDISMWVNEEEEEESRYAELIRRKRTSDM
ncbi:Antagonist of mitotic exit network protein 1 [Spathaspora sp. JA1]|nr:Antagonist of mitotic exit network protein 1 [Spathaspora sp. JA1]